MTFTQFFNTYGEYLISGVILACSFIVNIIQAVRTRSKSKLKDALSRIPEIIRTVEVLAQNQHFDSTTTATFKAAYKKATAEALIKSEVGDCFFKKYISVFDDAIEDILNTPQKKGDSDGISKENEER